MKDPLAYTYDGLERELNLLEIHLKEAPEGDAIFCEDCINKHISTARGFALEGVGFTKDKNEQKKFQDIEKKLSEIKKENYQKQGIELADEVRQLRKSLSFCSSCSPKDLNNPSTMNNHTHNSKSHISDYDQLNEESKQMKDYAELAIMNAGQFAAEGVRYLSETQFPTQSKWVNLGGGVVLQILPMFVKKIPKGIKTLMIVTGSNLLAAEVIKMIKGTSVGSARASVVRASNANNQNLVGKFTGQPNGRVFGGRVTATNIPSRYARAGILAGAQAFEAPEHADLIRVD